LFESGANFFDFRSERDVTFERSIIRGTLELRQLRTNAGLQIIETELDLVALSRARVTGPLNLFGSKIARALDMNNIRVGAGLFMVDAELYDVDLHGAHVGEDLEVRGSKVTSTFDLSDLSVGANLLMKDTSQFMDVNLQGARVGGRFELRNSEVRELRTYGLDVRGDVLVEDGTVSSIQLAKTHIGGSLYMTNATTNRMEARDIEVDHSVWLEQNTFDGDINLGFARIKGSLNFSESRFSGAIDLTRVRIDGELGFTSQTSRSEQSTDLLLILTDARVELITELDGAWPPRLELTGLTYKSVRSPHAFKQWFARVASYAPQPYSQLAGVVQSQGDDDLAREIRFAGRDRERQESSGWHQVWLSMLYASIGYGFRLERALYWVLAFVFVGTMTLRNSEQSWRNGLGSWSDKIVFSIDTLLPIIRLREKNYRVDLHGGVAYYFYFHKIMGYVLASFLIAGLSGLTK
jgi:hypothetical protein